MKYFDVRQSGDYASGAPWPATPPTLRVLDLPSRLRIPLASHLVEVPPPSIQHVSKGGRLADAATPTSHAALAPTSGRVVGLSIVRLLNGNDAPAIDVEPDFEDRRPDEQHDAYTAAEQQDEIDKLDEAGPRELAEWIDRLRECGVWADRAGSPGILDQLFRALHQPIDTVICNALDDEPTLRLNSLLAARYAPVLLAGLSLLSKLTQARRSLIALEAGAPAKWWAPMRRLSRKSNVQFVSLLNDYPQSDPTMLLHTLLRRRLRPGHSPVEQRVLLVDAAAAVAVGRCASRGQPMLQVPLAVRDHLSQKTHYFVASIGTPLRHVLKACDAPTDGVTLRRGSVLHENEATLEAVITGGDLTLHVMPRQVKPLPDPCIRCAWCAESCPTRVQPAGLLEASQLSNVALGKRYGLEACIECGVCTYVCPSKLPLLSGIRKLKVKQEAGDLGELQSKT